LHLLHFPIKNSPFIYHSNNSKTLMESILSLNKKKNILFSKKKKNR
jgi:hypothetical protein